MRSRRTRSERYRLSRHSLLLLAAALAIFAGAVLHAVPAGARGGPPNIMNSEGYQRALREERKQYQPAQPVVVPVATPRHRQHRHLH